MFGSVSVYFDFVSHRTQIQHILNQQVCFEKGIKKKRETIKCPFKVVINQTQIETFTHNQTSQVPIKTLPQTR
ncbi:hypothetical protein QR98_0018980 [Sarcoptes scabiei]|uniref:Uncharacterized protein n=1 Tax=Sarcoptes scabiei TaxID=52283 RepID=A0A131ZXD2_SARSC|nr:hypothetical protein QR98_0018980 [Sarcoptes scabiei]